MCNNFLDADWNASKSQNMVMWLSHIRWLGFGPFTSFKFHKAVCNAGYLLIFEWCHLVLSVMYTCCNEETPKFQCLWYVVFVIMGVDYKNLMFSLSVLQGGQRKSLAPPSECSALRVSGVTWDHRQGPVPSAGLRTLHGDDPREVPPSQLQLGWHHRTIPQWGEA